MDSGVDEPVGGTDAGSTTNEMEYKWLVFLSNYHVRKKASITKFHFYEYRDNSIIMDSYFKTSFLVSSNFSA